MTDLHHPSALCTFCTLNFPFLMFMYQFKHIIFYHLKKVKCIFTENTFTALPHFSEFSSVELYTDCIYFTIIYSKGKMPHLDHGFSSFSRLSARTSCQAFRAKSAILFSCLALGLLTTLFKYSKALSL